MVETYKFYVQMEGQIFGPYTAREVRSLELLDDILVTEESMNGQWLPASQFDFDDMVCKEAGISLKPRQSSVARNTQYNSDGVPAEIKKWNWGAFVFNWIWGVCNGVYWPLVLIIINFIPYIGWLVVLGVCVVLGIHGSEWAWKGKRWNNVEHFKRVQHNWAVVGVWVFCISFLIGFIRGFVASFVAS